MGVSFKVSKTGTRYKPKVVPVEDKDNNENDSVSDSPERDNEVYSTELRAKVDDPSSVLVKSRRHSDSNDLEGEVSFSLKLFQNGFAVGKAIELSNDIPEHLHPYDRASETLFSAIEWGWLPGETFDDLPCKYVNGTILCEIQDYRSCLIQGRAINYNKRIPIVHKVLLHMRMENVVKDILLVSDDSWTYRNLLEVESHILKAMQPGLHLNPQPSQDRYSGEPLSKKVDLGIMWSWKKRKLSNASDNDLDFGNSYHVAGNTVKCATQKCSSLFGLSYQERGVKFPKHNVSTSAVNPQENNILLENLPPLTSQPICKAVDSCSQSALTDTTSNFFSLPKHSLNNSNTDLSKPSSSILGKRVRCETQAVQGPLLKKPKQEPFDSSYQQLTGSQTETSLLPYLQGKNKLLPQQVEDAKVLHERFQEKVRPSLVIENCQTRKFQGTSELQAGMATSIVKLEPAEDSFPSTNVRMVQEEHCVMDRTRCQSNLLQSQKQQSSPILRDNVPADTSWNHMAQPADKNIKNRSVTQMTKDLDKFLLTTRERRASTSSPNINSLPTKVSATAKQKTNPRPKLSCGNIIDTSASTSNANAHNANNVSMNLTSSQPSGLKVDSFFGRLLKIQAITERSGLHKRKRKLNPFCQRKPFFAPTPLVAFHLSASNDNGKWENTSTDRISLSECSIDRGLNVCKMRTLCFLRQSCIHQENEIPIVDRKAQIRLVISENKGMVEANVLYGIEEEMFSIDYPLLPASPSSRSANLLATQFTSLMKREGYYLSSDQVEPTPLDADGGLSIQWHKFNLRIAAPSVRTTELPSSTLTPGLSASRLSPISMQLLSQNIFSGGQLLPTEKQSAVQIPSSCISKQPLNMAAQVNGMKPQCQQINTRAYLLYQMLLRQKQQNVLMQRRSEVGGLNASTAGGLGVIERGGGVRGFGNAGIGSFGSVMGSMRSSTPPMALGSGRIPWVGNVGQFNNLGSEISGLNDRKQRLGLISDNSAGILSNPRVAESQGKAFMSGVPVQRNAGHGVPMNVSNIPDMASKLSNQQQLQPQWHQPEMRSPPQQPQQCMVQQQQQEMVGCGSAEISSQAHVSVESSKM